MTHREKVDRLIAEVEQQGIGSNTVAPPLFQLLWALGLEIPPPLFLGLLPYAIVLEIPFGVLWGIGMWLWVWQGLGLAGLVVGVPSSVEAGLLFGMAMAEFFRWMTAWLLQRKGVELPSSWEEYPQG